MNKKLFILFSFAVLFATAQPGKEAWHWKFGRGSTLDFSSGSPVTIPGSSWATAEGSACISDQLTGQFLFGAEGTWVFDKNYTTMNNGVNLLGNTSTTQSDLIIPKPGNPAIYYIVTADYARAANKGVHYSVVDLGLQGGLGQVIIKNKILTPPPCTEKLVGARHCNGIDYWILTHPMNSNAINAYLVTAAGIDTVPVVSNVGTVHQHLGVYFEEGIGYMKVSPNGKKLALGITSPAIPILELFDFDNSSGLVSNPITINYPGVSSGPYGLTFSPDNSKLYTCLNATDSTTAMYQYDISSGIPSAIISSQTLISEIETYTVGTNYYANQFGAMQIGPDGNIYVSRSGDTLSVIHDPNNTGSACNFQLYALPILPTYYTYSFGLPNFIDANYAGIQLDLPDIKQCGTFDPDTVDAGAGFSNYYWSTGASTQTIVISDPGTYWVTVTNQQGCTRTDTIHAYLLNGGTKKNVSGCIIDTLNTTQSIVLAYNWNDSTTNPVKIFTTSGIYWEDISFIGGCSIRDTFVVSINPNPTVDLGPDTAFCLSNYGLNAQHPKGNYLWSTGETSQNINATKPGTYWVAVTDSNGCKATDTIMVSPQVSAFNFEMPNIVTPNGDNINDVIDFVTFQFSSLQIDIYNRWGQKVFESNDPQAIWRPTVDDGTYFYTAQYKIDCGTDSQAKNLRGFIQVLR